MFLPIYRILLLECVQQVFPLFFHMPFRLQLVFACIYTDPIDIMFTQLAQSLSPDACKVDRKLLGFVFWGKQACFVVFFARLLSSSVVALTRWHKWSAQVPPCMKNEIKNKRSKESQQWGLATFPIFIIQIKFKGGYQSLCQKVFSPNMHLVAHSSSAGV